MSDSFPSETLGVPTVPLPTVVLRPSGDTKRGASTPWINRPQVHTDDDGNSFLVIPCQHMDISIGFGEGGDGIDDMQMIIKQLRKRIAKIKEMEA